jgi:hypothetical protein
MQYRVLGDTLARQMTDELVLVNVATNKIFVANETGARLWRAIEGRCDLEGEIASLVEAAPDPDAARLEIEAFLSGLECEGFVAQS